MRLLTAARRVMGRKGVEAATIADITEEADLGLGTFYHHFDSKEMMLLPILADVSEMLGNALDEATSAMSDPAEVLSAAVRHMVRRVDIDASLGWFIVRSMSLPAAPEALMRRNGRDLQRGIDAGRFKVRDLATAQAVVCGAVVWVMQARLLGRAPADADEIMAAQILRALGVPGAQADRIASRPLPDLRQELGIASMRHGKGNE